MSSTRRKSYFVVILLFAQAAFAASRAKIKPPKPVATADIAPLSFGSGVGAQVAFLTEHSIVVGICADQCKLIEFSFSQSGLKKIAEDTDFIGYSHLYRSQSRLLEDDARTTDQKDASLLFDSNLQNPERLQDMQLNPNEISASGNTFVKNDMEKPNQWNNPSQWNWQVLRTASPESPVRTGHGQAIAISDDKVAYLDADTITIQAISGKVLGSFQMEESGDCVVGRFVGQNHIWLGNCGNDEIRDFQGHRLVKLGRPDGWGETRQSFDGSRLLYYTYTRHVGSLRSAGEGVLAVATAGMGLDDETSNGERVLVIDTANGRPCLDLRAQPGFLGTSESHADIDPSGKYVAVVNTVVLSVYKLPDACGTR
jgi:hypothetical protein